jgi:hypothetical protein
LDRLESSHPKKSKINTYFRGDPLAAAALEKCADVKARPVKKENTIQLVVSFLPGVIAGALRVLDESD